jgi:hypothetical protein
MPADCQQIASQDIWILVEELLYPRFRAVVDSVQNKALKVSENAGRAFLST